MTGPSYFDWFNAYFEVDFKVVQDANAEFLAATHIAMINDAASLIADMQVKQNGKTVYDRVTNIKTFWRCHRLMQIVQQQANTFI